MNSLLNNKIKIIAILLCAGSSQRMLGDDKITLNLDSQPVFLKSLQKFNISNHIHSTVVVASSKNEKKISDFLTKSNIDSQVIIGGKRRQDSVSNALNYIKKDNPDLVIIHDGARPFFSADLLLRGIQEYEKNSKAVVPIVPIFDTVKRVEENVVKNTIDRKDLFKSQTPQFFNYKILNDLMKLPNYSEISYTDEAELFEKNNILVKCIDGDIFNEKITNLNDYNYLVEKSNEEIIFKKRQGIASDVHKLEIGRRLVLGGIEITSKLGLSGHSDADVVLHAITDSIFGACSKGDLGTYFPSNDLSIKNSSSKLFLDKALTFMNELNLKILNIDIQIILQEPKLSGYIEKIEKNISKLLGLNLECINLKVTSTDKLGLIGNSEGIATLSSVSLVKK